MLSKTVLASAAFAALAAAAPAPQVPGYTGADAPYADFTGNGIYPTASTFGLNSQISATAVSTGGPPNVSEGPLTGPTSHGPFTGTPTTTGAEKAESTISATIPALPPNPTHTYYNPNGELQNPAPVPYTPFGGLGTNGTQPRYMVNSDFDFESIALALYQEWIELDLFHNGIATFSEEDFLEAGLTAEDRSYIEFMANQEVGHATLLTNMLGEAAPVQCTYNYPFSTVREFIDFNARLTKWGEAGVLGFLSHLDSREVAQMLVQSITTESRQQVSFRQMLGQPPMPVWFQTGIPQSWSWTYLAQYIAECPANQTRLAWQNFPALHIANNPNPNRWSPNDTADWEYVGNRTSDPAISEIPNEASCVNLNVTGFSCGPAIARNRSEPLSFPGRQVRFTWDAPGHPVGPNNSYITSTAAGAPAFVAWVSQLNLTYTPLHVTGDHEGFTFQPGAHTFNTDPAVNDTMFVALTDADLYLTPFNLTLINPHVVALGIYQAG